MSHTSGHYHAYTLKKKKKKTLTESLPIHCNQFTFFSSSDAYLDVKSGVICTRKYSIYWFWVLICSINIHHQEVLHMHHKYVLNSYQRYNRFHICIISMFSIHSEMLQINIIFAVCYIFLVLNTTIGHFFTIRRN